MDRIKYFLFVLILINATGCAISARSIEGHVVDAETGKPVPDVIVVVAWRVLTGFHGQTKGFLVLDETVTDKRGYYFLPEWKGKHVGFFSSLEAGAPELNFFKYGYELKFASNDITYSRAAPVKSPRESIWNRKTIELIPYKGDKKGQFRSLRRIGNYYTVRTRCTTNRLPILSREILRLSKIARADPEVPPAPLFGVNFDEPTDCTY